MKENKKIAANSIILYFRLFISTIIGLISSRIILEQLGAASYGLYSVVGGIVAMMNFLNVSMVSTSFRYIAYEIGKGTKGNPNKIFNVIFVIHASFALFIITASEIIGVYYIKHYLNIDHKNISDAIFVLRFSTLSTVFSVISVPYQGIITANEKFLIRATIEIIRAILKLIVALLLIYYIGNKLRFYSVLMFGVMIIPPILFFIFCLNKYRLIIQWQFQNKKNEYWNIIKYTGWIMIGAIAWIGKIQGSALMINLFFGTVVNAAYGISNQLNNYILMFSKNLSQAAVPQITKSYSSGDSHRSLQLVNYISKYSFFLMLLPALPLILSIKYVLNLWLIKVPEYTAQFTLLMIFNGLIMTIGSGFDAAIHATGKIRNFQLLFSVFTLATLPIAYLFFKLDYPPFTIIVIFLVATILIFIVQLITLSVLTDFRITIYLKTSFSKIILVLICVSPQYFLRFLFPDSLFGFISFTATSLLCTAITIYLVGLSLAEKKTINRLLNSIFSNKY